MPRENIYDSSSHRKLSPIRHLRGPFVIGRLQPGDQRFQVHGFTLAQEKMI